MRIFAMLVQSDKTEIMKLTRLLTQTILLLAVALMSGCTQLVYPKRYKRGFLYREGTQLMLDGKPYSCASFNSFQFCGCGHDYELFSDEELDRLFATLPDNIILRTWATPAFHHKTDLLVSLAEKHNVKLLLSLGDGRCGCGDFDGAINGDGNGKTPEWYEEGFRHQYLPHVISMVSRYKDSPAIAMWEIINEPGEAEWTVIRDFLHEVAATIKRYDPNHLVESGTFAGWAYEGYDNYKAMHDSPHIDVGNLHEYDYDYQNSNMIESPHFKPCLKAMKELDKVLIVGETGINSGDDCRTSRQTRVEAMRKKFDVYLSGGAGAVFVWNLANKSKGCGFTFGTDDPLLQMILEYQEANSARNTKDKHRHDARQRSK